MFRLRAQSVFVLLILLLLGVGCQPAPATGEIIRVFSAASLTDVMIPLGRDYEARHPTARVLFSFGSSSQMALQILDGAPADLFASANGEQIGRVQAAGRTEGEPVRFATNQLVLIVPSDNPAAIHRLADLENADLRFLLAVEGVPIREYTDQLFERLESLPEYGPDFVNHVRDSAISEEENVRFLAAKVALGEADAAIVYRSDLTPDLRGQVLSIAIDPELSPTAEYFVVPLQSKAGENAKLDFVHYLLSPEAQSILASWGFGPAGLGN